MSATAPRLPPHKPHKFQRGELAQVFAPWTSYSEPLFLGVPKRYVSLTLIFMNIGLGLVFEGYAASQKWTWGELAIGLVTIGHFFYYVMFPPVIGSKPVLRTTLFICLALALVGELVLSAVFELYLYRASLLPYFVPPGHVLLFIAGLIVAHDLRERTWLAWLIPSGALPVLIWQAWHGLDQISICLYVALFACLAFGRDKTLYCVMFALALALEILGTAVQAWTWQPTIAYLGLTAANPPLAAGVFYALLDLLTVGATRVLNGRVAID